MTANTPSVLYLRDFTSSARCPFAPTVFRSDDFDRCLSRVAFAKSVLLPERFRGGCSFGVITRRCRACTLPILRTPVWRSSASVAAQPQKNTPYQPLTPQLSAFNEALQQLGPYASRRILGHRQPCNGQYEAANAASVRAAPGLAWLAPSTGCEARSFKHAIHTRSHGTNSSSTCPSSVSTDATTGPLERVYYLRACS